MIDKIKHIIQQHRNKQNIRDDVYLIYYFPPLIKYTPLRDKRLLNILLPYIYNYNIDGKDVRGVLVLYGLPVHKKELLEFTQTKYYEKLFEYKAINFYANFEDLPQYQVRSIFNKLLNPTGVDGNNIKFEYGGKVYDIPNVEINYYPLVYRAYSIYNLLKEKESVLLRTAQKIQSWKDAIVYVWTETMRVLLEFVTRYPLHFMILIISIVILMIIMIVLGNAMSMLNNIQVIETISTNTTTIIP